MIQVREALELGQLVSVLEEFCAPFAGYYLYYPERRQASRALRAFIDHTHRSRRPSSKTPRRRPRPTH